MTLLDETISPGQAGHITDAQTIAKILNSELVPTLNVDRTGATNSTVGIVAALATAARVKLAYGEYLVDPDALEVPEGGTLDLRGVTLIGAAAGQLLTLNSDTETIGGKFRGFGSAATLDTDDVLIQIEGTLVARKSNIRIIRPDLEGAGFAAIQGIFCDDVEIIRPNIRDVAYVGAGFSSARRTYIRGGDIDMAGAVGSAANAYGVYYSRSGGDVAVYPRSSDSGAVGTIVRNNTLWEGFDTHGGERIKFLGVTALNCKIGVALVGSSNGVANTYAPKDCVVDAFTVDSQVTDGSRSSGIMVQGTATEKARACTIGTGTIRGHGTEGTVTTGGIDVTETQGLKVAGPTIEACSPNSVIMRGENVGFSLDYVSVDPWSNTLSAARHLYVNGDGNTGHLGSHTFANSETKVADEVCNEGVRVDNNAGNALTVGPGYMDSVATVAGAPGTMTQFVDAGSHVLTPLRRRMIFGDVANATTTPTKNVLVVSTTWNPGSLADGASTSVDFTVTGAAVGDPVFASHDQIGTNDVVISAHVRATNVVRVVLLNRSGGTLDIASGTVRVVVWDAT